MPARRGQGMITGLTGVTELTGVAHDSCARHRNSGLGAGTQSFAGASELGAVFGGEDDLGDEVGGQA